METLEAYANRVFRTSKVNPNSWAKEVSFILLQLVNGLKYLQAARSVEEMPATFDQFLLVKNDKDPHYHVIILNESLQNMARAPGTVVPLHAVGLASMLLMLQPEVLDTETTMIAILAREAKGPVVTPELTQLVGMFNAITELLLQKGSSLALGQVKSMLEYMIWGPNSITFESVLEDRREQEMQRWLDLERASVLNSLIKTQGFSAHKVDLTIFEEYHLLFLVQTCAKMLNGASQLFLSGI